MIVSIITINYNDIIGLSRTRDSVFSQTSKDYEWIVIDGGSTDGSKDYLANHSNEISFYISEKDNGVYNAMNKGIRHIKGDYVIFLNSGDSLHDESVIEDFVSNNYKEPVVYGNCISTRDNFKSFSEDIFPNELTLLFFYKGMLNHQSIFYRKDCFETLRYDEKYHICADKHLTLQLFYKGFAFRYWDRFIAIYNNGDGLTNQNPKLTESESIKVFFDVIPEYISKDYIRFNQMLDVDLFQTTKSIVDSNKTIRTLARIVLYPFRYICHKK